jgi:hypothetical protein
MTNKSYNFYFISVIIFGVFIFVSCPIEQTLVNIYPSNINIENYGTLKYTRTLYDGSDIHDGIVVNNEIWFLGGWRKTGWTVYKGLNKTVSLNVQFNGDKRYWIFHDKFSEIDKYILLFTSDEEYYDDEPYIIIFNYITKINKETFNLQYIKMPDIFMNVAPLSIYNSNNNVFIYLDRYYNKLEDRYYPVDYYYQLKTNTDNIELIKISKKTFEDSYNPVSYITDLQGRYYRIKDGDIEVSVDAGVLWHKNNMGTNYAEKILIEENNIYVFCSEYSEQTSVWGAEYIGGGIHIFNWD